jgi:hypothetical protein
MLVFGIWNQPRVDGIWFPLPPVNVVADALLDCPDTLPAASKAATMYENDVDADSPASEYDVAALVPIFVPARYTLYPVTPTLSVDAFQVRSICDEETAVATRLVGTEGGVVSGMLLFTVTVTAVLVPVFPAASFAIARSACEPFADFVVSHENA